MGILSISRNLLSKLKPKSFSSSDPRYFRRVFSQAAHARPTVVGDFLISHNYKGTTNYSFLSAAADNNNNSNSWKDHRICSPFSGRPDKYDLVGSCKEWALFWSYEDTNTLQVEEDGFSDVMVVDKYGNPFHLFQRRLSLWNPTTNRIKTLPPSSLPRPRRRFSTNIESFGFGFDPKSQDYKLICFLQHGCLSHRSKSWEYNIELNPHKASGVDSSEYNIEVYSLKTDSWKQITAPPNVTTPYFHSQYSVHINGVHYWARDGILSFDLAEETFSRISLPIWRMHDNYCLAEFHGSLAVIVPYWVDTEDKEQLQQPFSIKIWVWNGKTWSAGPKVAVGISIARVLGLFQNEYLFFQGWNEAELMLFNCKTGKLEKLGIHNDPPDSSAPPSDRRLGIFPYTVAI